MHTLQDLQSPNEYIRGSTLRFLCKLKEAELLEPLMPAIRSCLDHRSETYVSERVRGWFGEIDATGI